MKKSTTSIIAKLVTGIMSILLAINVATPAVTTAQKAKVKATYNPLPTIEEIKANTNNRNNNLEIVEDETQIENTNNDQTLEEEDEVFVDEHIFNEEEVVEVINISETQNDNITLKVYAAPKKEAAPQTKIEFAENKLSTASEDNSAADTEIAVRISGTGNMEENVYRYFVDNNKYVETMRALMAKEYNLNVDDVEYTLPEDIMNNLKDADLFDIDKNIRFYADGKELYTTDNVIDSINPADMLYYSPDYITIESGVESISDGAFLFCAELKSIIIPASVKTIGECAFAYCENLETVRFNKGLEVINGGAFMECRKLDAVKLPSTVTEIGSDAFSGCESLSFLSLNKGLDYISADAFFGCTSLDEVFIPATVTYIGYEAFAKIAPNSVITCTTPETYNLATARYVVTTDLTNVMLVQY